MQAILLNPKVGDVLDILVVCVRLSYSRRMMITVKFVRQHKEDDVCNVFQIFFEPFYVSETAVDSFHIENTLVPQKDGEMKTQTKVSFTPWQHEVARELSFDLFDASVGFKVKEMHMHLHALLESNKQEEEKEIAMLQKVLTRFHESEQKTVKLEIEAEQEMQKRLKPIFDEREQLVNELKQKRHEAEQAGVERDLKVKAFFAEYESLALSTQ